MLKIGERRSFVSSARVCSLTIGPMGAVWLDMRFLPVRVRQVEERILQVGADHLEVVDLYALREQGPDHGLGLVGEEADAAVNHLEPFDRKRSEGLLHYGCGE